MTHSITLRTCALALTAAVAMGRACAGPVPNPGAGGTPPSGTPSLAIGTISAVSATSLTLTTAEGLTEIVAIDAATAITVGGKKTRKLAVNERAIVLASTDSGGQLVATRITALVVPKPQVKKLVATGTLRSVGMDGLTLVDSRGGVLTVGVSAAARLSLDGKAAQLADFAPGDAAAVLYTDAADGKTAQQIACKSPKLRKYAATGTVRTIALAADGTPKSIAVTLKDGATLTVTIDANTQFVGGNGITVGAPIAVQYVGAAGVFVALSIQRLAATVTTTHHTVSGTATAVATSPADMESITVQPGAAGKVPITIAVTPSTTITVDGKPADLGAVIVSPPSTVKVNYHDETGGPVADKIVDGAGPAPRSETLTGTITGADASDSALTVRLSDGFSGTVTIISTTEITLDGAAATFADLQAGQHVQVKGTLDPTSGVVTASQIKATTVKPKGTGKSGGAGGSNPPVAPGASG